MRVKYFDGHVGGRFVGIEKQINEFLKSNGHIKVVDIKLSVAMGTEDVDVMTIALMIYEGESIG